MIGSARVRWLGLILAASAAVLSPKGRLASADERTIRFPEPTAQWVNSQPLSIEQLKGKAAFLWYFEEDCPRCREKWPMLLELSRRYSDEPIVFIGVNSGSNRGEVESYAKQNKITWPIVVDTSREFEKASGVGEISLQNIYQVRLLMADGSLRNGSWNDVEGSTKTALEGARWRVSPKGIPAALKSAWNEIELGNFAAAAPTVMKSLKAPKADVKEAAQTLHDAVKETLDASVAEAKEFEEAGEKWKAYRAWTRIAERFKGYELPDELEKSRKALAADAAVKDEMAAWKTFDTASKQLNSAAIGQRKKAQVSLEKLAKDKPDTEAGRKAQETLDNAGSR